MLLFLLLHAAIAKTNIRMKKIFRNFIRAPYKKQLNFKKPIQFTQKRKKVQFSVFRRHARGSRAVCAGGPPALRPGE
jgi:hypothetical protein